MMNIFIPISNLVYGKTRANLIGIGIDIPKGVSNEWAKWSRNKEYIKAFRSDYANYSHEQISRDVLNITCEDDPIATHSNNENLKALYPKVSFKDLVVPKSQKAGHLNFMRSTNLEYWNVMLRFFVS